MVDIRSRLNARPLRIDCPFGEVTEAMEVIEAIEVTEAIEATEVIDKYNGKTKHG